MEKLHTFQESLQKSGHRFTESLTSLFFGNIEAEKLRQKHLVQQKELSEKHTSEEVMGKNYIKQQHVSPFAIYVTFQKKKLADEKQPEDNTNGKVNWKKYIPPERWEEIHAEKNSKKKKKKFWNK